MADSGDRISSAKAILGRSQRLRQRAEELRRQADTAQRRAEEAKQGLSDEFHRRAAAFLRTELRTALMCLSH